MPVHTYSFTELLAWLYTCFVSSWFRGMAYEYLGYLPCCFTHFKLFACRLTPSAFYEFWTCRKWWSHVTFRCDTLVDLVCLSLGIKTTLKLNLLPVLHEPWSPGWKSTDSVKWHAKRKKCFIITHKMTEDTCYSYVSWWERAVWLRRGRNKWTDSRRGFTLTRGGTDCPSETVWFQLWKHSLYFQTLDMCVNIELGLSDCEASG